MLVWEEVCDKIKLGTECERTCLVLSVFSLVENTTCEQRVLCHHY